VFPRGPQSQTVSWAMLSRPTNLPPVRRTTF